MQNRGTKDATARLLACGTLHLDAEGNFGENSPTRGPLTSFAAANPGAGPLWREFLRRSRDVGTASNQPADSYENE
jgi:hypothetical protein